MHRVELKYTCPQERPKGRWEFLMHRVELKFLKHVNIIILLQLFLMHRVELKFLLGGDPEFEVVGS